jgi:hypothetical protein
MKGSESFHAHSGAPTNTRLVVAQTTRSIVSITGTLTQSAFHMNLKHHLSTTNLPLTITVDWDRRIERPDEFITDLFESVRDVPCQFRTYYIRVIVMIHIQKVQCIFGLDELA